MNQERKTPEAASDSEQRRVRLQDETRITGEQALAHLSAEQLKAFRDAAKLESLLALQLALLVLKRDKSHE